MFSYAAYIYIYVSLSIYIYNEYFFVYTWDWNIFDISYFYIFFIGKPFSCRDKYEYSVITKGSICSKIWLKLRE